MTVIENSRQVTLRIVPVSILVGILGMQFTYNQWPGLGYALLAASIMAVLFAVARYANIKPIPQNLWIVLPFMIFFTVMLAVRTDQILVLMNIALLGIGGLLLAHFFMMDRIAALGIFDYPAHLINAGLAIVVKPFSLRLEKTASDTEDNALQRYLPVLRGLLITLPIVVVFIVLFSAADSVFSDAVARIRDMIMPDHPIDLIGRLLYAVLLAWGVSGMLSHALLPPVENDDEKENGPKKKKFLLSYKNLLGSTEARIVLGGVALTFALFVAIQFVYLFGGAHNIENFNYAQYARRGFLELVIAALFSIILIFTINRITYLPTKAEQRTVCLLSTAILVMSGIILVSGFQRLRLYEQTYGFTTLRLSIYVIIVWLGVVLSGLLASLYKTNTWVNIFGLTCLIAVFGFGVTLNMLNPDLFVAWRNIERGDIDPLYLNTLSVEAVPALVSLANHEEIAVRQIIRSRLQELQSEIKQVQTSGLWSYNLAYQTAAASLVGVDTKPPTLVLTQDSVEKFLKRGMTTREVSRHLGEPKTQYISTAEDYVFIYTGSTGEKGSWTFELYFDSRDGLYRVMRCDTKGCTKAW